jgi:hypothetical protein
METDVLPTVSSGPVSTQSGFKLALACTRAKVLLGGSRPWGAQARESAVFSLVLAVVY